MSTTSRPPSILSEFGEGYCRHCIFVVGLDQDGMLLAHTRGHGGTQVCKGSVTRPPKLTPYASKKAAFRTKAEMVQCPVCRRQVPLLVDGRMGSHAGLSTTYCKGGYNYPSFRDHEGERG